MYIIFPSSYLKKNKVDEEFQKEQDAALLAGFDVVLFDQEKWDAEKVVSLIYNQIDQAFPCKEEAIYRGWMMKPKEYKDFYTQLCEKGLHLCTSPDEYSRLHLFKNSYPLVKEDAPKTLFFENINELDLNVLNKKLGRFMIKDFVKSVKGTDFPKFFDHPTKDEFSFWMKKFIEYRGSLFTGGIQAKEYLDLSYYGNSTNEYRVFYAAGNPISISRNSNQPSFTKDLPVSLIDKYKNLPSPFYTVDFIECKDGTFKVIETGDGFVSGLSPMQDNNSFFRSLYYAFCKEKDFDLDL